MENWINYLKEEEGYETISYDYGFCSFKIIEKELFCGHIFVNKEARRTGKGIELANEVIKVAKENGCEVMTGNIWYDGNQEKFMRKLNLFTKFGFQIHKLENNIATLILEV